MSSMSSNKLAKGSRNFWREFEIRGRAGWETRPARPTRVKRQDATVQALVDNILKGIPKVGMDKLGREAHFVLACDRAGTRIRIVYTHVKKGVRTFAY